MQTYRYTLQPLSAFGTPLAGDTLFGQLCWTLRHQLGNDRLNALLEGYTSGQPFAVVSDALPANHVPLPTVPSSLWPTLPNTERKLLKKKRWLPHGVLSQTFPHWQVAACSDADVAQHTERAQPHNNINRQTGTTGEGQFAPYAMSQIWFHPDLRFDLYVVLDETRLSLAEFTAALDVMGATGFGRDASIGLGKFQRIGEADAATWPAAADANSYLTLGPCAPQGQGFCPVRSFYQVVTRFGRHGDAAVQSGNPFKRPVLLAKAGSVFWPETLDPASPFIGQGLGGTGNPVSTAMPETVQQGYAPVIAIHRPVEMPA
ncbi:MAG: type III-A CRISPR-associated RAMP protein Csm4 [Burkholderiaceae bacterium]